LHDNNRRSTTREQLRSRFGARLRWLTLVTVMVGMMAAIISSTIVNVAVPDLSRHFDLGQERAQWISAAFMVAMTLALTVTPWLLARFGLRRTYLGACVLLMIGGIAGGLSNDFSLLIGMRVTEGIAAGILQPIPNVVIMRAFEHHERGRAIGIFGLGVVLAPAIGPSVGGFLVEAFGWRSIFFVVVPLCLTAIALARSFLPTDSSFIQEKAPLDWIGLLWISIATLCLLNGLVELNHVAAAQAWALIVFGFVGLGGFVVYQLRQFEPLLQVRLFAHRQLAMGALVAFVYGFGLFGSTYLLPVFLQMALQYSPSRAGLILLPAGLALAFTMLIAGRLADFLPASKLVTLGALLMTLSLWLMAAVASDTTYLMLSIYVIVGRIGLGIIMPSLSLGSVAGLEQAELPQAVSMTSFMRQLGGAVGVSLVGIVLEWRLAVNGEGAPVHALTMSQQTAAFNQTFLFLALVSMAAALAAWFMKPHARIHGK
jgi:MFS transporter, DHA2 family, multidrug resistance protein